MSIFKCIFVFGVAIWYAHFQSSCYVACCRYARSSRRDNNNVVCLFLDLLIFLLPSFFRKNFLYASEFSSRLFFNYLWWSWFRILCRQIRGFFVFCTNLCHVRVSDTFWATTGTLRSVLGVGREIPSDQINRLSSSCILCCWARALAFAAQKTFSISKSMHLPTVSGQTLHNQCSVCSLCISKVWWPGHFIPV